MISSADAKRVGGFGPHDGTIAFFLRVNSLLQPHYRVVDLGAGRGEWLDDSVATRRDLRNLKGKVQWVVGADIDPAVRTNSSVDEAIVMPGPSTLPMPNSSVDLIVSDHTFEHVAEPLPLVAEMHRILKKGGWVCARTPNRYGYIGIATNLVPNRHHRRILRHAQPFRKNEDVFPTTYRMNSASNLRNLFPDDQWDLICIPHNPEAAYFGSSERARRLATRALHLLPAGMAATLHIFAQKR